MNIVTQKCPKRKDPPKVIGGKQTRDRAGQSYERTALLTKDAARAFCHLLSDLPGISVAQMRRDRHQVGTKTVWYVRFVRAAIELPNADTSAQDIRVQRAVLQAEEMQFLPADLEGVYFCAHFHPTGDVTLYHTSLDTCDCPDKQIRFVDVSVLCKHSTALRLHLGLPDIAARPIRTPEEIEARRTRVQQMLTTEWGD